MTDVEVCTATNCSHDPQSDVLFVYPPGNPVVDTIGPATGPAQGGNQVVLEGANLGCIVAVAFGKVVTDEVDNSKALLGCGATNQVTVTAPPGIAGTHVPVRVTTVESSFDPAGRPSNPVAYAYKPSAPSEPTRVKATTRPGTATVTWAAPASDGGSQVTGYTVTALSPGLATVRKDLSSSARSTAFADLQAGAPWTFAVRAISKTGAGLAGLSNAVTPGLGDDGYVVETSDGAVLGFGDVESHGGIAGEGEQAAGIATTPDGLGYWVVTTTGSVTSFGDAVFLGDTSTANVAGIASLPDGTGYWIVTKSGVVHGFGQATAYPGRLPAGAVITGIASSHDGKGYWLVSKNGEVTAFGDARSYGSLSGTGSAQSVVAIAAMPSGKGYWLASAQGRVFAFGDARGYGSPATQQLSQPIVGMAAAPDGYGYWLVSSDGKVYNFGSAYNLGGTTNAAAIGV